MLVSGPAPVCWLDCPCRLGWDGRMVDPGFIVVLNGAPRSGKSSIIAAIQEESSEPWMNLGVDVFAESVTPPHYRPGVGLRPGGERPDLEPWVPVFYSAMYESVAAHSRLGLNVAVDVGHHDGYTSPRGILRQVAAQLAGLPAFLVGVRCPLEVIMQRRDVEHPGRPGGYVTSDPPVKFPRRCFAGRPRFTDPASTISRSTPPSKLPRNVQHGSERAPTAMSHPTPSNNSPRTHLRNDVQEQRPVRQISVDDTWSPLRFRPAG
jgi:chloramphenicol 3-O phosphotransferase